MARGFDERIRQQRLLHELMVSAAQRQPHKDALIVEGRAYTYAQLLDSAQRLAAALRQRGVERGDRVAIYMDNTWPCVVSIYATLLAGGVFLVINPQTKGDKLEYTLRDSGAKIMLTDTHLAFVFTEVLEKMGAGLRVISSGDLSRLDASVAGQVEAFDTVLAEQAASEISSGVIPSDLAALIYTSGSTGSPKGVMQTHQAMVFAAQSLIEYLRMNGDDRIFLALPMAFDYGLYQLLMAMALGATLVVERSFTFQGLVHKRMREERITIFPGVPTAFSMLISSHKKKPLEFPLVAAVTNTAAALPAEYIPALQEIFPNANIFKMYGLTECKRVSYLEPERVNEKPTSVGRAIPGTEVYLLSPEGEPVPPGEIGILHVRGPHVMVGYWQQPERTAKMLKPGKLPGERVLCTHDWFRMDEEGDLYFVGRSDDIIKTRGEKVSPLEVEQVVYTYGGIREAAVVGGADEVLGEAVYLYVSLESGVELTKGEIKKFCVAKLENFMVPKDVIIMDELPKTANGKIDKKQLQEMVAG